MTTARHRTKRPAKKDSVPQLIRELRELLGLSQERFAARLGVTSPTVNRWENARAMPSPLAVSRLCEIASALGESGSKLAQRFLSEAR